MSCINRPGNLPRTTMMHHRNLSTDDFLPVPEADFGQELQRVLPVYLQLPLNLIAVQSVERRVVFPRNQTFLKTVHHLTIPVAERIPGVSLAMVPSQTHVT